MAPTTKQHPDWSAWKEALWVCSDTTLTIRPPITDDTIPVSKLLFVSSIIVVAVTTGITIISYFSSGVSLLFFPLSTGS